MTQFNPIPDIERLGYTPREAGFLALVAAHSGYFLRRHFNHYLGKEDGGLAHSFLTKAQVKQHIRVLPLSQRRFVFHLCSRTVYRLSGVSDSQNRRTKGDRAIKTLLLSLDYVLDHHEQAFLRTQQQKMDYFRDTLGIDPVRLPTIDLASSSAERHRVYFPDRFPISILQEPNRQTPTISFAFVDDGIETLGPFHRFLLRHDQLFRALPSSEIVYIAESQRHFQEAGVLLAHTFPVLPNHGVATRQCPRGVDDFLNYLEAREVFEEPYGTPTFEQARVLAEGNPIYATAAHEDLYRAWRTNHITDEDIRARYGEKPIQISIRGYLIQATFPQNGPKYRGIA